MTSPALIEREAVSVAEKSGMSTEALIEQIKRDGFLHFENFFPPEVVQRAHQELEVLYAQDLEDRDKAGINNKKVPHYVSSVGHSVLTKPSHLLLNIFGKSPTFDQMFEQFLTDPSAAAALEAVAGKNLKLRGYNIRRMTGEYDPAPFHEEPSSLPHEWHMDSPGELCISFLFNDVPGKDNASTAFVPGSHRFPYNPRWECLFSSAAYKGLSFFLKYNIFNNRLAKRVFPHATGGYGKAGDAYLFINDTWHGRQQNLYGHHTMISFVGLFSTNYPFPDEVPVPSPEDLDTLPPTVRSVASQELSENEDEGFYLNQLIQERIPLSPFSLFRLAQMERRVAETISKPFFFTQWLHLTFKIKSTELKIKSTELRINVKSKVKLFTKKSERKRLKRALKQKVLSLFQSAQED